MPLPVNPKMLTLARESRGFNQQELENATGIDQTIISRFESGALPITNDHMEKIADALKYPVSFFMMTEERYDSFSGGMNHRKKAKLKGPELKMVQAQINVLRLHATHLLRDANMDVPFRFAYYPPEQFDHDIEAIAQKVRNDLELPSGPVPNVVSAIESAGGVIFMTDFVAELDAASQNVPDTDLPPFFFVNAHLPADRQRFTLAHEIGHIVMHRNQETDVWRDLEAEADLFASAFLMPAEVIWASLSTPNLPRLVQLKRYWKVSMAALILRAFQLGRITERQKTHLIQQMQLAGIRKKEPVELPAETPTILGTLFEVHRTGHGHSWADISRIVRMHEAELKFIYSAFWSDDHPPDKLDKNEDECTAASRELMYAENRK